MAGPVFMEACFERTTGGDNSTSSRESTMCRHYTTLAVLFLHISHGVACVCAVFVESSHEDGHSLEFTHVSDTKDFLVRLAARRRRSGLIRDLGG
jgi:hypothetical protein